jgi:Outer membrane receptor for Fe3+-dicitrate
MPQIVLRSLTSWLFILIALVGSAQTLQITGKVVDPNAQPISHVTVTVLSTKSTVMSNEGGVFNIAASKGDTLLFTSVGYENKTVVVANNRPLNVQLQYTVHSMEDVVIVGYGSQKRSNITGSIATVDFTELENIPQSNTLNILSGRVAGLSVIQPGSEPGADEPELYVRGVGTLNDASPLVIIDGVVATLADVGNLTPQEIREISVLKDASSAAIYGARGGQWRYSGDHQRAQQKQIES